MDRQGKASRPVRIGLFQIVLGLLVVALAVELVLLIRQNRQLKTTIVELRSAPAGQPMASGLQPGDSAPAVELLSIDGNPVVVTYDEPERETWLLVFSPDCPACVANVENWKRLERESDPARRRLIWISTASAGRTSAFLAEQRIDGNVLLGDPESLAGFRLSFIPTTIRIAPGGEVRNVWVGTLPDDDVGGG